MRSAAAAGGQRAPNTFFGDRSRTWDVVLAAVIPGLVVAGCAGAPRAEIAAYTSAYSEILTITNGVLDIVAPYERIVIRESAPGAISIPSSLRRQSRIDPAVWEAFAQEPELPGFGAPRPPPPELPGFGAPRPSAPSSERPPSRPAPPGAGSVAQPQRPRVLTLSGPCTRRVAGDDPYCYEMRDGYADIGDPPLVGAYRNLANVVLRFNTLLIAYADGVSGRLLQQELTGLATAVTELSTVSPISRINKAGAFAASFGALVDGLGPIVNIAGRYIDRAELRRFLLANYDLVDAALVLMARDSVELYANVAIGTNSFRRMAPPGTGQSLLTRRREIRRLISNWTVLLDDTRRLLGELKFAIETSDGIETRLHNLDGTIRARIDTSAIKKQIATLGTPVLAP